MDSRVCPAFRILPGRELNLSAGEGGRDSRSNRAVAAEESRRAGDEPQQHAAVAHFVPAGRNCSKKCEFRRNPVDAGTLQSGLGPGNACGMLNWPIKQVPVRNTKSGDRVDDAQPDAKSPIIHFTRVRRRRTVPAPGVRESGSRPHSFTVDPGGAAANGPVARQTGGESAFACDRGHGCDSCRSCIRG